MIASLSSGDGKYLQTQSSKNWTPLFLNAEPQTIGIILISWAAFLNASWISSSEIESGSSKNFSSRLSSYSATASIRLARYFSTSAFISSGISTTSNVEPLFSSCHIIAWFLTKSTTPLKSSSSPIGKTIGTALDFNISFICWQTFKKSDPCLSILFTNPILGTL